jgi:hypothetical protein
LRFYKNVGNEWQKKNVFDSLKIEMPIKTRFCNYNNDVIKDYLFSAGIVGTGGNETEYLFLLDKETASMKLIKGFENVPSTSYDTKTGIITSIGLAASIPNFEFYKIKNFKLIKIGGKEMWSESGYGYMEKYRVVNGKRIVYYRNKKKLPIDFYKW